MPGGEIRRGQVLEVNGDKALVQIFEGSTGLNIKSARVRFLGKSIELPVSLDMLGRVFSGLGQPRDQGPRIIPEKRLDINGFPINRMRVTIAEFIQTGVSAIDGMNTMVRGRSCRSSPAQDCPTPAWPRRSPAGQGACGDPFRGGFAAMGITFEEADYFITDFRRAAPLNGRFFLSTWPTTRLLSASPPPDGAHRGGISRF